MQRVFMQQHIDRCKLYRHPSRGSRLTALLRALWDTQTQDFMLIHVQFGNCWLWSVPRQSDETVLGAFWRDLRDRRAVCT